jgi:hypothetical protein
MSEPNDKPARTTPAREKKDDEQTVSPPLYDGINV